MVFKVLENTKLDILQDSIRGIVTRHEVLRTLIKEDQEGNSYQEIIDRPLEIKNINIDD